MEISLTEPLQNALDAVKKTIEHIRGCINSGKCNTCISCRYISKLNQDLVDLLHFTKLLFPIESDYLHAYLPRLAGSNKVNPFDFGGIIALVSIMDAQVKKHFSEKSIDNIRKNHVGITPVKIFISHSSKDKTIVESFITTILRLGCGLQPNDILCTSIESTGIKTGKDIRTYLQLQLQSCDYVFFMISNNYLGSSICLNEMGGAWVLEKDIKPFLFPNSDFSEMGWLYEISKGAKLNNEEALDELRDELLEKYKLLKRPKTSDWTTQKRTFISSIS